MNHLITAIALTTTLLLTQACSSLSSEKLDSESTEQHNGHLPQDIKHGEHTTSTKVGEIKAPAQVNLTAPPKIIPNTTVPLAITVKHPNGTAIENFDIFQEKLMHLIVVSDDLQSFTHLHPIYKNKGRFELTANFPQPGSYTLFSDYKPAQSQEQVSVSKIQVSGIGSTVSPIDFNHTKTFETTKINFSASQPTVKAGEEVTLMFDLKDAATNQSLIDLQPYLGEKGHLVIIRQSTPLTAENYIHAHALKNTSFGKVDFTTSFPQPGNYKLWGQFNRNGKIITADFWVNVAN